MNPKTFSNVKELFESYSDEYQFEDVKLEDRIQCKTFESYGSNVDLTLLTEETFDLVSKRISKESFENIVMNTLYFTNKNNFVYPKEMSITDISFNEHSGDVSFKAIILDKLTEKKFDVFVNDIQLNESMSKIKIDTRDHSDQFESFSTFLFTKN